MGEESRAVSALHIRPQSQLSTRSGTSTASASTSPQETSQEVPHVNPQQPMYQTQPDSAHGIDQSRQPVSHEEAIMLQAAYHLQNSSTLNAASMSMEGSIPSNQHLQTQVPIPYHQHQQPQGPGVMDQQFHDTSGNQSFSNHQSFHPNGSIGPEDEGQSFMSNASNVSASGTRMSRSSANNELDMRQLYQQNKARSLDSVAADLHGNERGPNSERTRQLFAMLWISRHCTVGKTSVPRGRVYANYASRCAAERVCVLNPASFGKLVRVLFQGLKTRRLGVRGESRYHYVNFGLIEDVCESQDQENLPPSPKSKRSRSHESRKQSIPPAVPEAHQVRGAGPTAPPPATQAEEPVESPEPAPKRRRDGLFIIYNHADVCDQASPVGVSDRRMTQIHHGYEPAVADESGDQGLFILPSMEPYLPKSADREAAHTLAALYRSHCTSLSECVRFCKTDAFFHNYKAFHGTLTMPVQKILHLPEMALWISYCDTILYQRIIRIISKLALQAIPMPVLSMLRTIAQKLVPSLREYNHAQPKHVVDAREGPAAIFSHLVGRAIRVNLTAHVVHNVLRSSKTRNVMWKDFIQTVQARGVASSVPAIASNSVLDILSSEMHDLIGPTKRIEDIAEGEEPTEIGKIDEEDEDFAADDNAQILIAKWDSFISGLRHRFPTATARDLMVLGDRVSSAITRDIIIGGGKSFTAWSVMKSWFDEMLAFRAEYGGFLERVNIGPQEWDDKKDSSSQEVDTVEERANHQAGSSRTEAGQHFDVESGTQATRAPFPPPSVKTSSSAGAKTPQHEKKGEEDTTPEDSGIGIRTPEYEAMMDKYTMDRYTFGGDDAILHADNDDDSVMVGS